MIKTSSGCGKAKGLPKPPKVCIRPELRGTRHRQEAKREQRQEAARQRHAAKLKRVASPDRLTGKALFYCESAQDRMKEIQRRLCEAKRENVKESRCVRRAANR